MTRITVTLALTALSITAAIYPAAGATSSDIGGQP